MRWAFWPGLRVAVRRLARRVLTPLGVPQRRWLEHYARQFATVENNGTFYRLPARGGFAELARAGTGDFVMTVKASRYLTHVRRLRDPADPVRRLWRRPPVSAASWPGVAAASAGPAGRA